MRESEAHGEAKQDVDRSSGPRGPGRRWEAARAPDTLSGGAVVAGEASLTADAVRPGVRHRGTACMSLRGAVDGPSSRRHFHTAMRADAGHSSASCGTSCHPRRARPPPLMLRPSKLF